MRHLGPLIARQILERGPQLIELAWHDPSQITPETLDLYKKPLQVNNWDKALWELTLASRASGLAEKLDRFTLPILVITGDDDRIVPTADSIRLADELPDAQTGCDSGCRPRPARRTPGSFHAGSKRVCGKNQSIIFCLVGKAL